MTHAINIHSAHVNPTQEISRSVKTEKIDIAVVYKQYKDSTIDVNSFRATCIAAINGSSGKPDKKRLSVNALQTQKSKAQLLFKTNNYFMAGQGLRV